MAMVNKKLDLGVVVVEYDTPDAIDTARARNESTLKDVLAKQYVYDLELLHSDTAPPGLWLLRALPAGDGGCVDALRKKRKELKLCEDCQQRPATFGLASSAAGNNKKTCWRWCPGCAKGHPSDNMVSKTRARKEPSKARAKSPKADTQPPKAKAKAAARAHEAAAAKTAQASSTAALPSATATAKPATATAALRSATSANLARRRAKQGAAAGSTGARNRKNQKTAERVESANPARRQPKRGAAASSTSARNRKNQKTAERAEGPAKPPKMPTTVNGIVLALIAQEVGALQEFHKEVTNRTRRTTSRNVNAIASKIVMSLTSTGASNKEILQRLSASELFEWAP
jgi:hypothetical protein